MVELLATESWRDVLPAVGLRDGSDVETLAVHFSGRSVLAQF